MEEFLFDQESKSPGKIKGKEASSAFQDIRSNLMSKQDRKGSDSGTLKRNESPKGMHGSNQGSLKNKDLHPNKMIAGQNKPGMDVKDLGVVDGERKGKRQSHADDSTHGGNLNS